MATVWEKASRARWAEGLRVMKGGEPGTLRVSGPSVFWERRPGDVGAKEGVSTWKRLLCFSSLYPCSGGERAASALLLLPLFPGGLQQSQGGGGRRAKLQSHQPRLCRQLPGVPGESQIPQCRPLCCGYANPPSFLLSSLSSLNVSQHGQCDAWSRVGVSSREEAGSGRS